MIETFISNAFREIACQGHDARGNRSALLQRIRR